MLVHQRVYHVRLCHVSHVEFRVMVIYPMLVCVNGIYFRLNFKPSGDPTLVRYELVLQSLAINGNMYPSQLNFRLFGRYLRFTMIAGVRR